MATKTAALKHKGKGATQRKKSKKAKQKQPNLLKYYAHHYQPLELDSQEFRIKLIRPDSFDIWLDPLVLTIEWSEDPGDPITKGTLSLNHPFPGDPHPDIHDGHRAEVYVTWGGKWVLLETLDVMEPESGTLGSWDFDLASPGQVLQQSTDDWNFKSTKKHKPHGWTCDEIAVEVARQYRIPLGRIVKGKYRIKHLSGQNISPVSMIQKAYALEQSHGGAKFIMRWVKGRLNITSLRRNPLLYTLGVQLTAALVGRKARDAQFATAVTVHGSSKAAHGKKGHKVKRLVVNERAVKQYGFIHKKVSSGQVKDAASAETFGKRYIARHSHRKRVVSSVEHPGIAFIHRGDAVQVPLPDEGLTGAESVLFVAHIVKRVSGGIFTMSLDLEVSDPVFQAEQERKKQDATKRKKERAKKKTKMKAYA